MRLRAGLLIVAILTALLGTLLLAVYISRLSREATAGQQTIDVYVAERHIGRGAAAADLADRGLVKKTRIPRRYVASGAIKSLERLGSKVLAAPLDRGEQLTESVFSLPPSGLKTPRDMLAVAVPIEAVALLNGRIQAGDHVSVFVTLEPGKDGKNVTRILLRRVLVLAADKGGKGASNEPGQASLALAVDPEDAEKLVFAATQGVLWAGLWPPGAESLPEPGGQTLDSLF